VNAPNLFSDELMRRTADRIEAELTALAKECSEDLSRLLGVPVDYSTKPPTRSKPGEYPRRDTGQLQASVTFVVYRTGPWQVRAVVSVNTPYDAHLHRLRPFMDMLAQRWQKRAGDRLRYALSH
jgi:hypothetical protein